MVTQNVNLTQTTKKIPSIVHVVQGDSGRQVVAKVTDQTISGTASMSFERPDGAVYTSTATINTTDNTMSVNLTSDMLNIAGNAKITFKVTTSNKTVSTFTLVAVIEPSAGFGQTPSVASNKIYVYVNGSAVEIAKQADVTSLTSRVGTNETNIIAINNDLVKLENFVEYEEIVISDNLISGKSIYTVDGTNYNGSTNWKRMKYPVEVSEGDIITYTGHAFSSSGGVVVYDENGAFLSALISNTSANEKFYNREKVVIPSGAKYVLCADTNQANTNETLVKLKRKVKKENIKMTYLYVSANAKARDAIGTKSIPFASIKEVNDYITENNENNRFTIIAKNGTYTDLQTFYSGKDGTYESGSYQGVNCKDYVYYESEDINNPQNCIIQWDGLAGFTSPVSYGDVLVYKCPFHLCSVHTHIKGFKFVCKNLRYCLHVESSGYGKNAKWEIANCIFDWLNCPDQIGNPNTPTIGMGVSHFEEGYIHDCVFLNSLPTYNGSGIMVHDNRWASAYTPYIYKGARLKLENNDFGNNGITVRTMIDDEYYNTKNIIDINGCNHIAIFDHAFLNGKTIKEWNVIISGSNIADNRFNN